MTSNSNYSEDDYSEDDYSNYSEDDNSDNQSKYSEDNSESSSYIYSDNLTNYDDNSITGPDIDDFNSEENLTYDKFNESISPNLNMFGITPDITSITQFSYIDSRRFYQKLLHFLFEELFEGNECFYEILKQLGNYYGTEKYYTSLEFLSFDLLSLYNNNNNIKSEYEYCTLSEFVTRHSYVNNTILKPNIKKLQYYDYTSNYANLINIFSETLNVMNNYKYLTLHPNRLKLNILTKQCFSKRVFYCKNCLNKTKFSRSVRSNPAWCDRISKNGSQYKNKFCRGYMVTYCDNCKYEAIYDPVKNLCYPCYFFHDILNEMHINFGKPNFNLKPVRIQVLKEQNIFYPDIFNIIENYSRINNHFL